MSIRLSQTEIVFLNELPKSDIQKVSALIDAATNIIYEYFGARTAFDIIICRGHWEMEVQIISRIHNFSSGQILQYQKRRNYGLPSKGNCAQIRHCKVWTLFARVNPWDPQFETSASNA